MRHEVYADRRSRQSLKRDANASTATATICRVRKLNRRRDCCAVRSQSGKRPGNRRDDPPRAPRSVTSKRLRATLFGTARLSRGHAERRVALNCGPQSCEPERKICRRGIFVSSSLSESTVFAEHGRDFGDECFDVDFNTVRASSVPHERSSEIPIQASGATPPIGASLGVSRLCLNHFAPAE
jgi:hypothetical protein